MAQQGQVFPLAAQGRDGTRWAYRYRVGGRGSRRLQCGGFASEHAAAEALERALEQLGREQGLVESPALGEFIDVYLAQHEGEPETVEKLRWLLAKAVCAFGECRLSQLRSPAIAAWRMTIPPGHRFEATQALRQVLARAVSWGVLDVNPAKLGVENPQRRYVEKRPLESWDELHALAGRLGPRHGPMVRSPPQPGCGRGSGSARAQRHRSRGPGRLRPSHAQKRPHQVAQDEGKRSSRTPAGDRTRRLRRVAAQPGPPAPVPLGRRRLPRPAQLPQPQLEAGPRRPPGSRCGAASTICGTHSRPSRSVPASPPSTSPATWGQASP
jgi:hypothetical protein